VLPKMH